MRKRVSFLSFIMPLWIRNSVSPTTTKYKSHSSCRFILESFDKFRTVWMRTHLIMLRDATHENLSSSLPPPLLRLAAVWYGPAVGLGYANSFYFSDRIFSILSTLFPSLSWTKQKSFLFFLMSTRSSLNFVLFYNISSQFIHCDGMETYSQMISAVWKTLLRHRLSMMIVSNAIFECENSSPI